MLVCGGVFWGVQFIEYPTKTNPPLSDNHGMIDGVGFMWRKSLLSQCQQLFYNVEWQGESLSWYDNDLCGFHYMDTTEVQSLLTNKTYLFVGDSQTRRMAHTTVALAGDDDGDVSITDLNADKIVHTDIVFHAPEINFKIDFRWAPCATNVARLMHQLIDKGAGNYDIVMISIGIHDAQECKPSKATESSAAVTRMMRQIGFYESIWTNSTVVFRTQTHPKDGLKNFDYDYFYWITDLITSGWIKKENILDQRRLFTARTTGVNRFRGGNTNFHVGPAGRLAVVQSFLLFVEKLLG